MVVLCIKTIIERVVLNAPLTVIRDERRRGLLTSSIGHSTAGKSSDKIEVRSWVVADKGAANCPILGTRNGSADR